MKTLKNRMNKVSEIAKELKTRRGLDRFLDKFISKFSRLINESEANGLLTYKEAISCRSLMWSIVDHCEVEFELKMEGVA